MQAGRTNWHAWYRATAAVTLLAAVVAGADARGGNYLIVSAPDYAASAPLNEFITAKMAQGFTVSVYSVPAGTSRTNIKSYIEGLWGGPSAPKYVLIVGDTDGSSSTANTIPHWVGEGSRNGTTDLPYACMDGPDDWYPEIFIGRFSVRTVAMLQDVVDKTLWVEAGNYPDPDYVKRAAMLATDDSTAQAAQNHDWVIATYLDPAEFESTKIYAAQGGGTSDITAAVNAGSLFTVYFGHSDSGGWWTPGFNQSNVNSLTNEGLYGLAMGWSCNTAHFDYSECYGETWLRKANAGAAAYLSASNYVWWGSVDAWDSSRRMERYFFGAVFEKDKWEIGPAWQRALYTILADPDYGPTHDHTRNIFEEFVLLGDPSLLLPQGEGFTLSPTPAELVLCSPPETEAVYTIEVGQMGEFAETVTLSAVGAPAGTTVDLSVASDIPPFTSVLTISDIDASSAGDYTIQIDGTSASMERSSVVGLSIAAGAPPAVTLDTPADGATGVAPAADVYLARHGGRGGSMTTNWRPMPNSSTSSIAPPSPTRRIW